MTDDEFVAQLVQMRETMYRISYVQLQIASDRDDAVQETLLKAWHNRHKLRDERYMQTWVIRILINECHNIHRRQKREVVTEAVPEQAASDNSYIELFDALFRLDEKLYLPVLLHYIEGYRVEEVSNILGIPKGTVLWRLSKARKELSLMLDADGDSCDQKV